VNPVFQMIEDEMDDFVIFLKTRGEKIMRKLAGYVALVVAVLMVSSVAMAFDFRDHVKQSHGGKGDTLIFPFYAAINGGWETKLTVINTATDRSVVAKVVFNSQIYSMEILDFMLFLTPTDVWTGIVRYNPTTGKVEVFSDDDSMLYSKSGTTGTPALVWASTTPVQQAMMPPALLATCNDNPGWMGYVTVYSSAHSTSGATYAPTQGAGAVSLNAPPVNKQALWRAHEEIPNSAMALDGINVLTGYMEFRNNTINQKATLQATALKDYDGTIYGTTGLHIGALTTFFDITANNAIGEVEAALSKTDLAMYYTDKNLTLHFLTFPTKYTVLGTTTNVCGISGFKSPFFTQKASIVNGCINYSGANYDLRENASSAAGVFSPAGPTDQLCGEVNYRTGFAFSEGWARYSFNYTSSTGFDVKSATAPYLVTASWDGDYTGAPVIGTVLNLGSSGDGYTLAPAAFTDGRVRDIQTTNAAVTPVNQTIYHYYQYQDERNTGFLYDADLPSTTDSWGTGLWTGGESHGRLPNDGHHPINNPALP